MLPGEPQQTLVKPAPPRSHLRTPPLRPRRPTPLTAPALCPGGANPGLTDQRQALFYGALVKSTDSGLTFHDLQYHGVTSDNSRDLPESECPP